MHGGTPVERGIHPWYVFLTISKNNNMTISFQKNSGM